MNIKTKPKRSTFSIFIFEIICGTFKPIKNAINEGTVKKVDPCVFDKDKSLRILRKKGPLKLSKNPTANKLK